MTDAQYQTIYRQLVAIERAAHGIREVLKECRPPVVPTNSLPR